ncbi:ABC transporter ATP-binding protein [Cytobacillus sp. Hm23]
MNVIQMNNLTKFFGKNRGIENVTLEVEEGEIFGFIGPNGAGKSTTIRTLLNLIYPTKGSATVFGLDVVKDTKEIRKIIGYLPSEVHYYDDMKAKDLLQYSSKFYKLDTTAKINELAERLDLDLTRKVEDLSFGNRKKVGIIQALLHQPKLLILDEPTSGLDPLIQQTFFDLLHELRDDGTTIFFSSHYLGEVQKMCDRVGIIKEGRVLKVEQIEQLRHNQFKKVSILFSGQPPQGLDLEGVINQEVIGDEMHFLYSGNATALIKQLYNFQLTDINIEEPSLEEVFMHYYEN